MSGGYVEEACYRSEMLNHWKYNGQHYFLTHSVGAVLQHWRNSIHMRNHGSTASVKDVISTA